MHPSKPRTCGAILTVLGLVLTLGPRMAWAEQKGKTKQNPRASSLEVEGEVVLASLMALGDGHLQKFADGFALLATRQEVLAADWALIKAPLQQFADLNVPAVVWFALPSGEYWTLDEGHIDEKLSSRAYFPRLLSGETVIGDLVVSTSTGKNVAIVAVPVMREKKVVGILGCSIYLDKVSEQIKREMALRQNMIFYSFDAQPLLALEWDQSLIFTRPQELGPEIDQVFRKMLTKEKGSITYRFRGKERTVIFQKSNVTKWWYAFGLVPEAKEEARR